MSNTNLTAVQIRNNKVVQNFRVTASDFAELAKLANCEPKSIFAIEDSSGQIIEIIK